MNTQPQSQLIQYIWLISNPWLKIVPSIYTITIINSSHYYRAAMKIFDLQAAPITISCYSHGKMEAKNIGLAVTRARNDNHDQSRRYSMDCSYSWATAHCCIWICCSLFQLPLYSLCGIVSFNRVLWETMEWMAIILAMNVHPSLGMLVLLHLYPLHLKLSL